MKKTVSSIFSRISFGTLLVSMITLTSISLSKDGDVIRRSNCSGPAKSKLKASPENGRIEVEYEVDNATRGQRWVIVLKKGRRTILQRTKTVNSAGEIRVRKVTSNGSGSERISALARNLNTGERCSVTLRFRG